MSYNFDTKKYGRLLAKAVPRKIDTEEENERVLAIIEKIMAKDENKISEEELALLRLLSGLVEEFEESYTVGEGTPLSALQVLVEEHGLKQKDLHDIFGSSGITSEVFSGKHSISKAQAKKLGERFRLPADVFI